MEHISPEYLVDLNLDGYFGLGHDGGNQGKPREARFVWLLIFHGSAGSTKNILHQCRCVLDRTSFQTFSKSSESRRKWFQLRGS